MFGGKDKDRGLIPRSVEYLFDQIPRLQQAHKDVTVEASFLEIYCGKIRDLGSILREVANMFSCCCLVVSLCSI
jgi:hypothetical protein